MKANVFLASLLALSTVTGCSEPSQTPVQQAPLSAEEAAQALEQTVERNTAAFFQLQPGLSTTLTVDESLVGGEYDSRLPDYSEAGMNKMQTVAANAAKAVIEVDTRALGENQKKHQKIVANIFEYYAGDDNFPAGYIDSWAGHLPYIINQISGPLIDLPKAMQVQQGVANKKQADAYIARLEGMDTFVNAVVAKFRKDMDDGVILPKKLHPKTLSYFNNFLATQPREHELVTSFAARLDNISSEKMSDELKQKYIAHATELMEKVVYPAYNRARDAVFASERRAKNSDGIWSQPGGDEFYQHAIHTLGDSDLTAEEIHQLGLDEVERIASEMDRILTSNGFSKGSVGERMLALNDLPGQVYPATSEGRKALLSYLNGEIEKVMAKAPDVYGRLPLQSVEVRRIPAVSEAGEAGGYYSSPSMDGSRPGIYWINLRDMEAVPKFGLKTLTYHEAVPGHHFQIALSMSQKNIGLMRQNAPYNAFVEGWALYSEYIASEVMGMYEDDPLGELGRLQAELYRAVRLVVDTGIHYKHWTREQAIDYFHTTTGTPLSDVVPEIERYMAWPGQALGYKLGMLTFVELEKQARSTLGEDFDIKAFHDVILLPGARPMKMVRKDVEKWIATLKS